MSSRSVVTGDCRPQAARAADKPLRIGFLLARAFTMSAFSMFADTLRLAGDEGDRSGRVHCDWEVLSSTGHLIRSSVGIDVAPTSGLGDPRRFTHVAVVGGLLRDTDPLDPASIDYLRRAAAAGVPLIGICTGSFILAAAGLLRGRRACVSWFHYHDFKERFPDIDVFADRLFFVDGNRITCAGGAGAADLAAQLVERHLGRSPKEKALQVLQIERARPASAPQPRAPLAIESCDDRVRRVLLLMDQSIADPLPLHALAAAANLSLRQMERLFAETFDATPGQIYTRVRMAAAHRLLVDTDTSIGEIGNATGFPNASHFTRRFRASYGVTPSELRAARPA
jgi:transcriptional regulator GlxA family with amidase domain